DQFLPRAAGTKAKTAANGVHVLRRHGVSPVSGVHVSGAGAGNLLAGWTNYTKTTRAESRLLHGRCNRADHHRLCLVVLSRIGEERSRHPDSLDRFLFA